MTAAVITQSTLDMAPSGNPNLTGAAIPQGPFASGIYRFRAETRAPGTWTLRLVAEVPGETRVVREFNPMQKFLQDRIVRGKPETIQGVVTFGTR